MQYADEIALLQRHLPLWKDFPPEKLERYMGWYANVGCLGVFRLDGEVQAVGLARCVTSVEEAQANHWAHHEGEEGRIIWVENIAGEHPAALAILLEIVARRFGRREMFCGDSFTRAGDLRMISWAAAQRLIGDWRSHELTRCRDA